MLNSCFEMTEHARDQLELRWPETVLRPRDFAFFGVTDDMQIIGYDKDAFYYKVRATPMVAVVRDSVVLTVFDESTARQRLALRGYGPDDCEIGAQKASRSRKPAA